MATETQATERSGDRLDHGSVAGEVVRAYLSDWAGILTALDVAVRRDEPDAVHQMRVAARRLRATLQSFPAIWPPSATGRLKDDLRWLGRVLGDARDIEVLGEYFRDGMEDLPRELVLGPAKARVTLNFAPQDAEAREAVIQVLDSPRYLAMLDELAGLLATPPQTPAARAPGADVLPDAVAHAYRRARRRMRRAFRTPSGPRRDVALHQARKAVKRARYAAEATVPACGKNARRFAKRMKAVQKVLGDHHDVVTARAAARDIGVRAHLAGENAFSFGLLHERAYREALEYEDQARHAWKRAKRPKSVSWLRT